MYGDGQSEYTAWFLEGQDLEKETNLEFVV